MTHIMDLVRDIEGKMDELQALVPVEGPVADASGANKALERFRVGGVLLYDLYNNGLCNRERAFYKFFGVPKFVKYDADEHDDDDAFDSGSGICYQGKVVTELSQWLEPKWRKIVDEAWAEQFPQN